AVPSVTNSVQATTPGEANSSDNSASDVTAVDAAAPTASTTATTVPPTFGVGAGQTSPAGASLPLSGSPWLFTEICVGLLLVSSGSILSSWMTRAHLLAARTARDDALRE